MVAVMPSRSSGCPFPLAALLCTNLAPRPGQCGLNGALSGDPSISALWVGLRASLRPGNADPEALCGPLGLAFAIHHHLSDCKSFPRRPEFPTVGSKSTLARAPAADVGGPPRAVISRSFAAQGGVYAPRMRHAPPCVIPSAPAERLVPRGAGDRMRVGLVRAVAGPSGRRAWAPLRWPGETVLEGELGGVYRGGVLQGGVRVDWHDTNPYLGAWVVLLLQQACMGGGAM